MKKFGKMRRRYMSALDIIRFIEKKYPGELKINKRRLFAMKNGQPIMGYKNTRGNWTVIVMQRGFIQSYSLTYSTTQKRPEGKELLISNFRLPKFK